MTLWLELETRFASGLCQRFDAPVVHETGTVESDLFFSIAMFGTPVFLLALSRWMHKTSGDHIAAA